MVPRMSNIFEKDPLISRPICCRWKNYLVLRLWVVFWNACLSCLFLFLLQSFKFEGNFFLFPLILVYERTNLYYSLQICFDLFMVYTTAIAYWKELSSLVYWCIVAFFKNFLIEELSFLNALNGALKCMLALYFLCGIKKTLRAMDLFFISNF